MRIHMHSIAAGDMKKIKLVTKNPSKAPLEMLQT